MTKGFKRYVSFKAGNYRDPGTGRYTFIFNGGDDRGLVRISDLAVDISGLDFELGNIGSVAALDNVDFIYSIVNNSTRDVAISEVVVSQQSNVLVTVISQPASVVTAGSSTSFTLSISPIAAGAFSYSTQLMVGSTDIAFTSSGTSIGASVPDLLGIAKFVLDASVGFAGGPYTTYNGTTPSTGGGDWGNVIPSKMDIEASRYGVGQFGTVGTYITDEPIDGAGVLRILAAGGSHNLDVSTGLKYLTAEKWWFGLKFRIGSGTTDANNRFLFTGTSQGAANSVDVKLKSSTGVLSLVVGGTSYDTAAVPSGEHVIAAYYDGTNLYYWLNSITRVDVTTAVPTMGAPTTSIIKLANEIGTADHEVDFASLICGITDDYGAGNNSALHRSNMQAWVNSKI